MTYTCEFLIDGVVTGISGTYHVIGRCGDVPFRVGDVFDQLDQRSGESRSVHLRVTQIQAYQRSLEELGVGMTASIDVEGEGVELLGPNAVLVANSVVANNQGAAASQAANNG